MKKISQKRIENSTKVAKGVIGTRTALALIHGDIMITDSDIMDIRDSLFTMSYIHKNPNESFEYAKTFLDNVSGESDALDTEIQSAFNDMKEFLIESGKYTETRVETSETVETHEYENTPAFAHIQEMYNNDMDYWADPESNKQAAEIIENQEMNRETPVSQRSLQLQYAFENVYEASIEDLRHIESDITEDEVYAIFDERTLEDVLLARWTSANQKVIHAFNIEMEAS